LEFYIAECIGIECLKWVVGCWILLSNISGSGYEQY